MYIWDINLRIFHWLLVVFITFSIISGKLNNLFLHQFFGSISLGLICFRFYWGFFGTNNAIFKNFIYSPKEILFYIIGKRTNNKKKTGHNPLGSLSVFSFYIIILVLSISGLFSSDDILFDGPLVAYFPENTFIFTKIHNFSHYLIYFIITIHIVAILYYQFILKQKLINQMIDGKARNRQTIIIENDFNKNILGFIILISCIIIPIILLI